MQRAICFSAAYNPVMPESAFSAKHAPTAGFVTTCWSMISAARASNSSRETQDALESLCQTYWRPLYAFTRRSGYNEHDAQDIVQGFFEHLLKAESLKRVSQEKGKFRSFLLASLKYFVADKRDFANAAKRGGGKTILSFDASDAEQRYRLEPVDRLTPREIFDRQWAMALIEQALARLHDEARTAGREALFDEVKELLAGDRSGRSYAAIAADLGLSDAAVKMAVVRLRRRFRDCLRESVAATVSTHVELEEELASLRSALTL